MKRDIFEILNSVAGDISLRAYTYVRTYIHAQMMFVCVFIQEYTMIYDFGISNKFNRNG